MYRHLNVRPSSPVLVCLCSFCHRYLHVSQCSWTACRDKTALLEDVQLQKQKVVKLKQLCDSAHVSPEPSNVSEQVSHCSTALPSLNFTFDVCQCLPLQACCCAVILQQRVLPPHQHATVPASWLGLVLCTARCVQAQLHTQCCAVDGVLLVAADRCLPLQSAVG